MLEQLPWRMLRALRYFPLGLEWHVLHGVVEGGVSLTFLEQFNELLAKCFGMVHIRLLNDPAILAECGLKFYSGSIGRPT
jgi:hypothetical protein